MSVRNQVTAQFANIAIYDTTTGNVAGIAYQSNINSNGNSGAFVVGANLLSNALLTSIGNGNIYTSNSITVGNNIAINGNGVSTDTFTGAFSVTANSSDFRTSTSISNGQIRTGGNIYANGKFLAIYNGVAPAAGVVDPNAAIYSQTPLIQLNTGPNTAQGIRIDKNGTNTWFVGADSSSANGNFLVTNRGSSTTLRITDGTGSSLDLSDRASLIANGNLSIYTTAASNGNISISTANTTANINISVAPPPSSNGLIISSNNYIVMSGGPMIRTPVAVSYNGVLNNAFSSGSNGNILLPINTIYAATGSLPSLGLTRSGTNVAAFTNTTNATIWYNVTAYVQMSAANGPNTVGSTRQITLLAGGTTIANATTEIASQRAMAAYSANTNLTLNVVFPLVPNNSFIISCSQYGATFSNAIPSIDIGKSVLTIARM